ncbi:Ribosome-binding factor A [Serratia symbiotica]|nr:Ribosome-binding factor A [Serratia symbiotica]
MKKKKYRTQRISKEIKKGISIILQYKLKDLNLGMITISDVKISHDLTYAKVYVTFLNLFVKNNNIDLIQNKIKILQNISGYIQGQLGKMMYFRLLPKLTFFYDNTLLNGIYISNLVNKVINNDFKHYNIFNGK